MCVVSQVYDYFQPDITKWSNPNTVMPNLGQVVWGAQFTGAEVGEIRALLADFRKAKAAAEVVDKLTKQPDCVDPEKAKLEQKIQELERIIKSKDETMRAVVAQLELGI